MSDAVTTPSSAAPIARRTWSAPRLAELPKLTKLTLASAIGGGGGTGGGGSTVFGLLLAVGLLAGCTADRSLVPGVDPAPAPVASIPCVANVVSQTVRCGGLFAAPGQELLGGQGVRVILRSTNVHYVGTAFTFDVSVQNLSTQSIGANGGAPTGLSVFFEQAPIATVGSGVITVDNATLGNFTGTGQPFYFYPDSLANLEISSAEPWEFTVPGGVDAFSFTVLVAADVGDAGGVLRWKSVPGLGALAGYDVAASTSSDALIVGDYGRSIRWNGTSWSAMSVVTQDDFNAAGAIAPGEYLAGTFSGGIFRSKGKIWTQVHQRADSLPFYRIWVRDSTHFVAVGAGGAVTWYANGVFTDEVTPPGEDLYSVTGRSDGSVVLVASQTGIIDSSAGPGLGWDGSSIVPLGFALLDIAYDAAGKYIFAAYDPPSQTGFIVHEDIGAVFVQPQTVPTKVFPFDSDSISAFIFDYTAGGGYMSRISYGASPTPGAVPYTDTMPGFSFSVALLDASHQRFVTGGFLDPTPYLRDGGNFTQVEAPANCGCFSGIWGKADTTWLVDGSTTLWKVVNGAYTQLTAPVGANKIWGFSAHELYVTADSQVWKGDGIGPWTLEATLEGNFSNLHEIWGDPASGLLITVGDGGHWMTREGGVWTSKAHLGANLNAVWGCSATEAWLVSQDGPVFHWQSGTATLDPAYDGPHGASGWYLGTVTGSGCNDVWTAGAGSFAFHWTGAAWDSVDVGVGLVEVNASAMKAPGRVYFGGDDGKGALVSASGTESWFTIPTQGHHVHGLWQLLNGELVVIDGPSVLRGLR